MQLPMWAGAVQLGRVRHRTGPHLVLGHLHAHVEELTGSLHVSIVTTGHLKESWIKSKI